MEKTISLCIVIYLVFISLGYANAQQNVLTMEQEEAVTVLDLFLDAQRAGDTETIKECLGGDLLKKRLDLLNNPDYSAFLYDTYKDARFKILHCKTIGKNSFQIDVKIMLNSEESQIMRYNLLKTADTQDSTAKYLIISQIEITTKSPEIGN